MSTYDPGFRKDYWDGWSPSKLGTLSNRALFMAVARLEDAAMSCVGTADERAKLLETLEECYRERDRRAATLR